jgi:hypothetical protein
LMRYDYLSGHFVPRLKCSEPFCNDTLLRSLVLQEELFPKAIFDAYVAI